MKKMAAVSFEGSYRTFNALTPLLLTHLDKYYDDHHEIKWSLSLVSHMHPGWTLAFYLIFLFSMTSHWLFCWLNSNVYKYIQKQTKLIILLVLKTLTFKLYLIQLKSDIKPNLMTLIPPAFLFEEVFLILLFSVNSLFMSYLMPILGDICPQ